jgi:hypothetical protein
VTLVPIAPTRKQELAIVKPMIAQICRFAAMKQMAMTILRTMIAVQSQELGMSRDVPMWQRVMAILRATIVR